MFYSLVRRNSKRNRKENGLFFVSLIITIIAFYIILSLKEQDVILFLKTLESDALHKLFLIVPALYGMSLFILFFLVYFAGKYQLERRSKELGMYLMLGMKRSKLLLMLFAEELYNSVLSLIIGIPVAIFLSEIISLVTAKIVGLGIRGHHFSFSLSAVIGTVIGYFIIRFAALIILIFKLARKEVTELLNDSQDEKKRERNKIVIIIELILGIALLGSAFTLAIKGYSWVELKWMSLTVVLGLSGMFSLFHGIGILFEIIMKKKNNINGLGMFSFRQLQESVFLKPNTLAVSSVLILAAVSCFAYGIPVGSMTHAKEPHVIDYTFDADKTDIQSALKNKNLDKFIPNIYEMKTGLFHGSDCSADELTKAIDNHSDSQSNESLFYNLYDHFRPDLIAVSSFNNILRLQGKKPLELKPNEAAIYQDPLFTSASKSKILEGALAEKPVLMLKGEKIHLVNKTYSDSIITDQLLTLSMAFIVPDELFDKYTNADNVHIYWNAVLDKDFVNQRGLMMAMVEVNNALNTTGLRYESYLQNMGRELFYRVAAGYTTIYLAVIFLIIANTVMGVQFLMHQQKTRKRYQTLAYIGGTYEMLCKSARKQITWYFMLPIGVAVVCSIFAVRSLFTGVMTTSMRAQTYNLMKLSIPIIITVCMVELLYMHFVKKSSDRNISKIMTIKREDN